MTAVSDDEVRRRSQIRGGGVCRSKTISGVTKETQMVFQKFLEMGTNSSDEILLTGGTLENNACKKRNEVPKRKSSIGASTLRDGSPITTPEPDELLENGDFPGRTKKSFMKRVKERLRATFRKNDKPPKASKNNGHSSLESSENTSKSKKTLFLSFRKKRSKGDSTNEKSDKPQLSSASFLGGRNKLGKKDPSTVVRRVHSESEAHTHAVNKSGQNVSLKITCSSTIVKHAPIASPDDGTLSPPSARLENIDIDEHDSLGKCDDTPDGDGGFRSECGYRIESGFRTECGYRTGPCFQMGGGYRTDGGYEIDGENEEDGGFVTDGHRKGIEGSSVDHVTEEGATGGDDQTDNSVPFHKKSEKEKDVLYEDIAKRLDKIATFEQGNFPGGRRDSTASTMSMISSVVVQDLIENMSFENFEHVMNRTIQGREAGLPQISVVFRLARSAVNRLGFGSSRAATVENNTMRYFSNNLAQGIVEAGGWENVLPHM